MHILDARRNRIELIPVSADLVAGPLDAVIRVADAEAASERVTRATRAFLGLMSRKADPSPPVTAGPLPAVFKEAETGVVRMAYKEIVVRFRPGVSDRKRRQILKDYDFAVRSINPLVPNQVVVYDRSTRYAGAGLVDVANDWTDRDEVLFATPNFISQFRRTQAVSIPTVQWHLRNKGSAPGQTAGEDVDAKQAWEITRGKRTITVAILDDGVDLEHPNLKANIRKNPDPGEPRDKFGRDFFIPDDDHPEHFNPRPKLFQFPFDQMTGNDIHGTPCAGVVAAAGHGALGIAPKCRILAVKIFHADAFASDARVADAIRYAASHADVLSCSWSGPASPDIQEAVEQDAKTLGRGGKGAAVFCAAGNLFGAPVGAPARHPAAIAVGASTDQAKLASYSNVGPELWVVAPSSGGIRGIFTTDVSSPNRGFNIGTAAAGGADGLHTNDFGGTSSATPLAAGIAALMLSVKPSLEREAVKQILADTADKIGTGYDPTTGHSPQFGFGRVNAAAAVDAARNA